MMTTDFYVKTDKLSIEEFDNLMAYINKNTFNFSYPPNYICFHFSGSNVNGYLSNYCFGEEVSYGTALGKIAKCKNPNFVVNDEKLMNQFTPKPRFHKKRKPVPKRKKTDVVITYRNGMTYTLKNIIEIKGMKDMINLLGNTYIDKGIRMFPITEINRKEIHSVVIKTPRGSIGVYAMDTIYRISDNRKDGGYMQAETFSYTFE